MANVEYLICSFCQGPSSKSLRSKLRQHLNDPALRIRSTDLDWLDNWRLLLPSHVEWDTERLRDVQFQNEYENELPKTNVVSKINWVPSIEGRLSTAPEWDDLDGWRTIEFSTAEDDEATIAQQEFPHSLPESTKSSDRVLYCRTLHPYNDDIDATRLPFHSACLRILYEACNEVTFSTYATSTVSDVVHSILIPSWKAGDVHMDYISRLRSENAKSRLIAPWGEHWHPLDPQINVPFLSSNPANIRYSILQSILLDPSISIKYRAVLSPNRSRR